MIHLSELGRPIELETEHVYNLCVRYSQVIVKSQGQHTYLQKITRTHSGLLFTILGQ